MSFFLAFCVSSFLSCRFSRFMHGLCFLASRFRSFFPSSITTFITFFHCDFFMFVCLFSCVLHLCMSLFLSVCVYFAHSCAISLCLSILWFHYLHLYVFLSSVLHILPSLYVVIKKFASSLCFFPYSFGSWFVFVCLYVVTCRSFFLSFQPPPPPPPPNLQSCIP